MLVRLLIYIKHHFTFLWRFVEGLNSLLYRLLHRNRQQKVVPVVMGEFNLPGYTFRVLQQSDIAALAALIARQESDRLAWFKPHGFDEASLHKAWRNPAFLMMGAFDGPQLVGYFFLRFFWNRRCFVGRLIDLPCEGKGIGRTMNNIMYHIGWRMGFRVLSTISKNNHQVMRSHANNPLMKVLKELDNDFLFVEFVENNE
ncbi:MAG: hypothetical protein K0B15_15245 [Lentimicrobium sp.]|nr:hypothetical protein [Lentimicrobium sp.]